MIDVELAHEVLDSLRAMKDRGTPLPRCHKGPIRGVEDSWRLVRFADGTDTTLRPETTRRVELHGWGPESVLTALGLVKPDDVELQVLWEDLGQGETETVHRYQWTDGGGGVVLTGRDDSAVVTEG